MWYLTPIASWQIENGTGIIAQGKISVWKEKKCLKTTGIDTLRSIRCFRFLWMKYTWLGMPAMSIMVMYYYTFSMEIFFFFEAFSSLGIGLFFFWHVILLPENDSLVCFRREDGWKQKEHCFKKMKAIKALFKWQFHESNIHSIFQSHT